MYRSHIIYGLFHIHYSQYRIIYRVKPLIIILNRTIRCSSSFGRISRHKRGSSES